MDEGSGVVVSCGVGRRRGSDLALVWLWCRPAATALIRSLAWEPPYAAGAAIKKDQKKKKKREKKITNVHHFSALFMVQRREELISSEDTD